MPSRAPFYGGFLFPRQLAGARGQACEGLPQGGPASSSPLSGAAVELRCAADATCRTSASAPPTVWQRVLPSRLTLPAAFHTARDSSVHLLILAPQAAVVGLRHAPSTGPSAHPFLPFIAGSFFGAISLVAWQQSVQADSRPLPLPPPPPGPGGWVPPAGSHAALSPRYSHHPMLTVPQVHTPGGIGSAAPSPPLHTAWQPHEGSAAPPLPSLLQPSQRGLDAMSLLLQLQHSAAWGPLVAEPSSAGGSHQAPQLAAQQLRQGPGVAPVLEPLSWPWGRAWDTGGPPSPRPGATAAAAAAAVHPLWRRGVSLPDALPPGGAPQHMLPDLQGPVAAAAVAHHVMQLPRPGLALGPPERPPLVPELSPPAAAQHASAGGAGGVLAAALAAAAGASPFGGGTAAAGGGAGGGGVWSEPLTRGSISEAAAAVSPAVVHIVVAPAGADVVSSAAAPISHASRYRSSSGSGFIYHPDGYVLTNAHVVASAVPPATQLPIADAPPPSTLSPLAAAAAAVVVSMTLSDGRVLRGRVVALDRESDVAVLRAELPPGEQLPAVGVARTGRLRAGEWVVALGTPLMLKQSVTAGIVSCVERRGHELGLEGARTAYIQTDAAINQGNSGGPLVNLDGLVVGMNVFKAVAADGVSFAIPMDTVCEVVKQLHEHGRVIRPYVGVTLVEVSNGALRHLQEQVPQLRDAKSAVVIQAVKEGSPAQLAGLQAEDIICTLDGRPCMSLTEMVEVFGRSVSRPLMLTVIRQPPGFPQPQLLTKQLTPVEAHS